MGTFDPVWTEPSPHSLGRDPLGLQATSVRIYRALVPGLTNVTNRLRYFSFYCWAVEAFGRRVHADDAARWRAFIRRAEALYAIASLQADPDRSGGMAGREWAERVLPDLTDPEAFLKLSKQNTPAAKGEASRDKYLAARGGNFGQFYVASMLEVGMLTPSKGHVPLVSEPLGRDLARAFRAAAGAAGPALDAAERALMDEEVRVADLGPIGAALGPQALTPGTEEMALLRAYLEGGGQSAGSARLASACLLLDYIRRLDGAAYDEGAVREAFYNRVMPDGSPFDPDLQIINLWRAYQANELCHAALAALFNGLMSTAVAGPSRLQPAVLCRTFAEEVSARAGAANRLWGDWAGDAGAEGSGQERSLQEELVLCLDGTHGGAGNFAGLTAAVRLLATLWARWAGGDGDVLMLVRRHGGPSARSIASVVGTLEEHSSAATGEAVAAVLLRHAVREHLGIAARKLLSGGLDTYHFTLADGLLGDAVCRRFFDTNPRLGNLSRFLEDAAFHQNHRITADGSAFLRAHGLA